MTATKPSTSTPSDEPAAPERERFTLSATQLIASGLAAMSATVAASFFGVAGTVIGAALGSVTSVVGNAVYSYSLRRTHRRVRQTLDVAVAHRFATQPASVLAGTSDAAGEAALVREPSAVRGALVEFALHPKRLAIAAVTMFVAVIAVTTVFEFASGQPLSSTVTGKHGSGVSIGGGSSHRTLPTPSSPRTATPSHPAGSSHSPSSTPSGPSPTVTVTVTPSGSEAPSQSAPGQSPAPSQSAPGQGASSAPAPTGSASGGVTPAG
ncbi:MAG TPA: hypothetical protein VMB79_02735 [Jatrophihabitans sp.]|nr:hypothetical protein [Jatrophihabitans sp.]